MLSHPSRVASRVAALTALMLVPAACGGENTATTDTGPPPATTAREVAAEDFSPDRFAAGSENVTNRWFPLEPGRRFVFDGSAMDGKNRLDRRVISIVTDLRKEIGGIPAAVAWERDFEDGELVETELAFFAQDRDGVVWQLGEYPEEFEEGEFVAAPSWIHGVRGATAGIHMQANPRLGTPDYAQGFAPPPVNWVDRGRVYKVGVSTCVPADCYDDVLVIEEFETGKPDAYQLKFYARGVGNVRVGWRGKKEVDREVLELVEATMLDAAAMDEVRAQAMALEAHAYEIKNKAYAATPPLERLGG